jgi:hypothetical protein
MKSSSIRRTLLEVIVTDKAGKQLWAASAKDIVPEPLK